MRQSAHFGERAPRRRSSTSAPDPARCCSPRSTNGRRDGLGIDASAAGARLCRAQRRTLGMTDRAALPATATGRSAIDGQFDLILSNPPYIDTDERAAARRRATTNPHAALFAGADGLDDYRVIAPQLPA